MLKNIFYSYSRISFIFSIFAAFLFKNMSVFKKIEHCIKNEQGQKILCKRQSY